MAVGAGTLRLALELTAKDMTGGAFASAAGRTRRFSDTAGKDLRGLIDKATSYRKLVTGMLAGRVLARGFGYIETAIGDVTRNIVEMDKAMMAASAKFGPTVARNSDNYREMERVVRQTGATTEWTTSQVAKGIDFLAMAGFGYEQSLNAIIPLTDLATASQMDLARASDIASDALGAFNMSTAPEDIELNLRRINDVFAETVTSSNTTMETLFDTMKLAGPVVEGGVVMFGTLAGTLGSAGIKGTIAATTLKNMFLRLQAPPSEAGKALKKLGINIDDGSGQMKSMIEIIGDLNRAFEGVGEIQRKEYLKDIFGQRAISGANILLQKGQKELQKYYEQLDNSSGAAREMADTMRGGLAVQIEVLRSTLMSKGMDIFTALMGTTDPADAIKDLVEIVREFDVGPIVEGLKTIGEYAKGTAEFLWEWRRPLMAFAQLWAVTNIVSKFTNVSAAIGQMIPNISGMSGGVMQLSDSFGAFARQNGALKTSLLALGPVVQTLVASITIGYNMWKSLQAEQTRRDIEKAEKARESLGLNMQGERLDYGEMKSRLNKRKSEWDKFAYERKYYGEEGLDLLTGPLSSVKDTKQLQLTARGLNKQMELQRQRGERGYRARYDILSGKGGPGVSQQGDFYYGQNWGDISRRAVTNVEEEQTTRMEQTLARPKIVWNPEQKFDVNVNIEGLPEGTAASATIEKAPGVGERELGVPNG